MYGSEAVFAKYLCHQLDILWSESVVCLYKTMAATELTAVLVQGDATHIT